MAYFTLTGLKVLLLILGTTKSIEPQMDGYAVIANILQTLFKAYTHKLRESRNFVDHKELNLESSIEKAIKQKIDELRPFLEDNERNSQNFDNGLIDDRDDNVTLEGDEETTIIEFIPHKEMAKQELRINEPQPQFKDNVKKYKKLRDQIKEALLKESVSIKTQKLVTNTLDSMLAQMVRSNCPDEDGIDNNVYREKLRNGRLAQTKDLTKNWTAQWNAIKEKYDEVWSNSFSERTNPAKKLYLFFEQIQEFLIQIVNDTDNISNNYKVVCKLVKKDEANEKDNFNDMRASNVRAGNFNKKVKCLHFKVCSSELENFMSYFYKNLHETVANTFRNYMAMYQSDVNSDGSGEKEMVIAVVNKLGAAAKHKVKKIFKSETSTFELDHDRSAEENMKLIKAYVHNIIQQCINGIKSNVNSSVMDESLRTKLVLTLKQDLAANINVDLENLEADMKAAVCKDFSTCNGNLRRDLDGDNPASRRHGDSDNNSKNKVYVKLQFTLDKKLKKNIANGKFNLDTFWRKDHTETVKNVDVTRTNAHKQERISTHKEILRATNSYATVSTRMRRNLDYTTVSTEIMQ
ncbi:uncharacterized protein LOC132902742 [Amyelois transitella]|uniref:uncharacterized protein LOC132902742 n=1 Tax=Amyelois transitella TaxID=680683 RepID=UPI00298F75A1|nr:uncharacterized protein LOC132902742 [Amyelois transitella]